MSTRKDSCHEKSKFTEEQVAWALKQADLGTPVEEVCRKLGIAKATFFNWKKKYGGMSTYELRCMSELETENQKLKQLVADLSLDKIMLQDALSKKLTPSRKKEMVTEFTSRYKVSERRACAVLRLNRSTYKYQSTRDGQALTCSPFFEPIEKLDSLQRMF